ncbi:MAG TPA: DUF2845 domain-containing protein, partial [Gammaproteobacteria bacterium]|nr:DUF2845 domain-containing protein [Gammaproteobacteria bacterium]
NSINVGDSIATVLAACGEPDSKTSNNKKATEPQEWAYYVATDPSKPGTMKLTVAFDENGMAINISVNGSGMPQTQLCANGQIQLGDTQEAVQAACGKPTYINQTEAGQKAEVPETEILELTYRGPPSVILVFENGRLTQRK